MPSKLAPQVRRPSSPSEYGSEDERWLRDLDPPTSDGGDIVLDRTPVTTPFNSPPPSPGLPGGQEPRTPDYPPLPPRPRTPPPLALPPIPRSRPAPVAASLPAPPPRRTGPRPGPSVPAKLTPPSGTRKSRTIKLLPDRPSATIQRVVNYRIHKERRSQTRRPGLLNPNPRSSPFHCPDCRVTCTGSAQWAQHLRSRKHTRRPNNNGFTCHVCNLHVTGTETFQRHLQGRQHRQATRLGRN